VSNVLCAVPFLITDWSYLFVKHMDTKIELKCIKNLVTMDFYRTREYW